VSLRRADPFAEHRRDGTDARSRRDIDHDERLILRQPAQERRGLSNPRSGTSPATCSKRRPLISGC